MNKLILPSRIVAKVDIANVHAALRTLNLTVDKEEIISKNMGKSTANAIKAFQKKYKLRVTGKLNKQTINVMNEELFDAHYSLSKTRTAKLHNLFELLSVTISKEERKSRVVGTRTRKVIKDFQKKIRIKADGKINQTLLDALHEKVITQKFTAKNQYNISK